MKNPSCWRWYVGDRSPRTSRNNARPVRPRIPYYRSQYQPAKADNSVRKHNGKTDPYDPALGSGVPVSDIATSPTLEFGERRKYCPSKNSAKEHMDCRGRPHDYALTDVRRGRVEVPKPDGREMRTKDRDAVELRKKIGY